MANNRTIQRGFSGGELTPEFFAKSDDVKYANGLAECTNFVCLPHGPLQNRSGFKFVREVKDSSKKVRILPFKYSVTQTAVIELGAGYTRFHTDAQTYLSGTPAAWSSATAYTKGDIVLHVGAVYYCIVNNTNQSPPNSSYWYVMPNDIYEIPNDFLQDELFDIHYVQSNDIVTLAHKEHPPSEIRRYSATNWQIDNVQFNPDLLPPTSVSATAIGVPAGGVKSHSYIVTASISSKESEKSLEATCLNNLLISGAYNLIAWTPSSGGSIYNVYKKQGGVYGFIGNTNGNSLVDDNITPDISKTPPVYEYPFINNGITNVQVLTGGANYGTQYYTGGSFVSVSILNGGSGYNSAADSIVATDPTGTGASFSFVTDGSGKITSCSVVTAGNNYSSITLLVSSSTGSGAVLSATVTPIILKTPYLQVSDPTGTGASLIPVFKNNSLVDVYIDAPGKNYTNPIVSWLDSAGGSGATFGKITLSGKQYPQAVSYFEQRRCFAGTASSPQTIWMTKTGTESIISASSPTRDDDRILFKVAARESNSIQHLVPLNALIMLTDSSEYRVTSVNSDAITPTSFSVKPQSYIGSTNVQPLIVNNSIIFCSRRGGHVIEMGYVNENQIGTINRSIRSTHLFNGYDIVDMAYSQSPNQILWFVRSDGVLLGMTYLPEQQVFAWHKHTTDGLFESIAVVPENGVDNLYAVIKRTINGLVKRYIERLEPRIDDNREDAFFVDSGLTYAGAETTTITGLDHLEGKTVNINANGIPQSQKTVVAGSITLDYPTTKAHIGLPIIATAKTLPVATQADRGDSVYSSGRALNINKAWLRTYRSNGLKVGFSEGTLLEFKERTTELPGTPTSQITDVQEIVVSPGYTNSGQLIIKQDYPLPTTISSVTMELSIGG